MANRHAESGSRLPGLWWQAGVNYPRNIPPETVSYLDSLRRDIEFSTLLRGEALRFRTTWGLFSPKAVDEGSRLLLDYVEIRQGDHSLDLGCGYGPLGLTLARLAPQGNHMLVDKDFVAVEYTRKNAKLNNIDNVDILLSNGFNQIEDRPFDVIVSNLPAKTGKELYYLYFYDALTRLRPGGRIYVVTITGLRRFIQRAFLEVFGNYDKLKQGSRYTVAAATFGG